MATPIPQQSPQMSKETIDFALEAERRGQLKPGQLLKLYELRDKGMIPAPLNLSNAQSSSVQTATSQVEDPIKKKVSEFGPIGQSLMGLAAGIERGLPGERSAEAIASKITGNPSFEQSVQSQAPISTAIGEGIGSIPQYAAMTAAAGPLAKTALSAAGMAVPESGALGFILDKLGKLARGGAVGGTTAAMQSPGVLPDTSKAPIGATLGAGGEAFGMMASPIIGMVKSALASKAAGKAVQDIAQSSAKVGLPMEEGFMQNIGDSIQQGKDLAEKNLRGAYGTIKDSIFGPHGDKAVPDEVKKELGSQIFNAFSKEQTNPELANQIGDFFNKASKQNMTLNDLAALRKDMWNVMKSKGEWKGAIGKLTDAAKNATDTTLEKVGGTDVAKLWRNTNIKYNDAMDVLSRLDKATEQNIGGFLRDKLPSETYRQTTNLISKSPEFIDKALATNPELQKPLANTIMMDIAQKAKNSPDKILNVIDSYGKDRLSKILPEGYYKELMDNVGLIAKAKDASPILGKMLFKTLLQSAPGAGVAGYGVHMINKMMQRQGGE